MHGIRLSLDEQNIRVIIEREKEKERERESTDTVLLSLNGHVSIKMREQCSDAFHVVYTIRTGDDFYISN